MVYKCGNVQSEKSKFNFIKRWHLEKTVLNHSRFSRESMFLFAYRAFIDALGSGDKATIKKMTEPVLCARLFANIDNISKFNAK